jgi:ATP-dependent DNA helicase RecQ
MSEPREPSRTTSSGERDTVHAELRSRFGIERFRPGQEEIILKVLAGQNVLAIYPAGYGKSLLYQLPAALLPGMTLVFSPLVALMHDQQATLSRRYGIACVCLTHVLQESNPRAFYAALGDIRRGRYRVVFIAPEKLDNDRVMDAIRSQPISLVALDEAHCISVWGHDFRPHYRRILRFVADVKPSVVLGLTATAPPPVEADILRQIAGATEVFRVSPHIPNLRLHIFRVEGEAEKLSCLAGIIPRLKGNGVVYCGTHEECENVAEFLNSCGIESTFYHAGLGPRRHALERDFLANRWKVVAATCALGMGIDKRDLRFVIHYRFPGSPEFYYQEIGRAGRDGQRAECVLLYDPKDRSLQEFFLSKSHPEPDDYGTVWMILDPHKPQTSDAINGQELGGETFPAPTEEQEATIKFAQEMGAVLSFLHIPYGYMPDDSGSTWTVGCFTISCHPRYVKDSEEKRRNDDAGAGNTDPNDNR